MLKILIILSLLFVSATTIDSQSEIQLVNSICTGQSTLSNYCTNQLSVIYIDSKKINNYFLSSNDKVDSVLYKLCHRNNNSIRFENYNSINDSTISFNIRYNYIENCNIGISTENVKITKLHLIKTSNLLIKKITIFDI